MKKLRVAGLLSLILFGIVASAACAYAAETAKKTAKEKLAILDLEAKYGIAREFAEGLSVIVRDEIHSFGDYEVMSREDLQAVASQEQLKQALGCEEGGQCLIDFGRAIGTRFMVVGSISKFGSTYTISLRMLDTQRESAGVVNRASLNCKCAEDELIVTAQNVAAKLMGKDTPEMLAAKQAAEKERLAAEKIEAKKAEKAEKEKQAAIAEEKRKADEAEKKKIAVEQARLTEEKKRLEEAERQKAEKTEREKQAVIAEEKRKADEAEKKKLAAEQARQTEEKKRLEEVERKKTEKAEKEKQSVIAEERRKADEAKKKIAEEQALVEEKKRKEEAKQKSLSALEPKSGDVFTDPTTGMELVYVPKGCFQMGDTFDDGLINEKPVHEVCVDGFYIGRYEVTQEEYSKITGSNPLKSKKGDRYPVETVSWDDAQAFIQNLNGKNGGNYRLPTEAEWEYAARSGGRKEKYSGADSPDAVSWNKSNSSGSTHQVGTKSPNSFGLYDMTGNVWEWCQDWYDSSYYNNSPRNNPKGAQSGVFRVFRGGGWDDEPWLVRVAFRYGDSPDLSDSNVGFRLVLSVQ